MSRGRRNQRNSDAPIAWPGIGVAAQENSKTDCDCGNADMTYSDEIKSLLAAIGYEPRIYSHEPTRETCRLRPLTARQRHQVDALSRERGYRRFVATYMQA